MNKTELISAISDKTEIVKKDVEKMVKAFEEIVTEELSKKSEVKMVGFGTFDVKERVEHTGRNPQTGEPMVIPATLSVKFKPGKTLKDAVNNKSK